MAAQTPFNIAIPDTGVAAQFTDGELALSVNNPQSSTPAGVKYISRMINLAGGRYTVKINAGCHCSLWAGEDLLSTFRVAAFAGPSASAVTAEFHAQPGANRLDLVLSTAGGPCWAVFSLWQYGKLVYTSTASQWSWDTAYVPDATLAPQADPRLTLPVFSFTPNWKGGVTERITFVTDVFTSESDTEQRRSMVTGPRRMFEADFMRSGTDAMRLNNFIVGVAQRQFIVPFWPEQTKIGTALSPGVTAISFAKDHLDGREFRAGGLAVIYGRDPAVSEVVVIDSIVSTSTDELRLVSGLTKTWPAGSRIAPAYVARFDSLPPLAVVTDRVFTTSIGFRQEATLTDADMLPSWGYCAPLWQMKLNRAEQFGITNSHLAYEIDTETAPVEVFDYSDTSRVSVKGQVMLVGREKVNTFKSFIAQARGRAARFWWPSGTHDIEPVGSVGGLTLDVRGTGYATWMIKPQDCRLMIGVYFNDGSPTVYRRISNSEVLPNGSERLTFTQALQPIPRTNIERISFILPVRFDQDTFELHHVTDNAKVVQAAVVVRSSTIAGLPDIECSLTSWTYPQEAMDSMDIAATVTGGTLQEIEPFMDSMNVAALVTGGTLENTLTGFTVDSESFDVAALVTGGTLENTLTGFTVDADSFDVAALVTAGTLETALLTHTVDSESFDVTATVTGGTLT